MNYLVCERVLVTSSLLHRKLLGQMIIDITAIIIAVRTILNDDSRTVLAPIATIGRI